MSSSVFTPEQTRYLGEELEKIVAVAANHDEWFHSVAVAATEPVSPAVDDVWVDTSAGFNISVGTSEPTSPNANDLWVDTN